MILSLSLIAAAAALSPETERARGDIWSQEQAIYRGRSVGDLTPYLRALAKNYVSWPPLERRPLSDNGLRAQAPKMKSRDEEQLEMELMDFTLNGSTAIIYYQTHRTRLGDGSAANEWWEVTHTWIREGDHWKVLGGMARLQPERP